MMVEMDGLEMKTSSLGTPPGVGRHSQSWPMTSLSRYWSVGVECWIGRSSVGWTVHVCEFDICMLVSDHFRFDSVADR